MAIRKINLRKHTAWLLSLFALLLYVNTIPNDYSLDDVYVTNGNPQVAKGFSGMVDIFTSFYENREGFTYGYRPVVKSSFAMEYELWGFNPHLSHLVNAILYALLAFIIYRVSLIVFKRESHQFVVLLTAFFIAIPLHTETVASLKNRDELLACLFAFGSALFLINANEGKKHILNLSLGILMLLLALLSKLSALPMVIIIPLLIFHAGRAQIPQNKGLFHVLKMLKNPFFVASASLIVLNILLGSMVISPYDKAGLTINSIFLILSSLLALFPAWKKMKSSETTDSPVLFYASIAASAIVIIAVYSLNNYLYKYLIIFSALAFQWISTNANLRISKDAARRMMKRPPWYLLVLLSGLLVVLLFAFLSKTAPSAGSGGTETYQVLFWQNPLYFSAEPYEFVAAAGATLLKYTLLFIWPFDLAFYYGYDTIQIGAEQWTNWLSLIVFLILTIWALIRWYFRASIAALGFLILMICLSMYSNLFVPVAGIVAERLAFLASFGYCILLARFIWKLPLLFKINEGHRNHSLVIIFLGLAIILPFTIKTADRNRDWNNYMTLFRADIGKLTRSVKANDLMAAALFREASVAIEKGRSIESQIPKLKEVVLHYQRCVEIYPEHDKAWSNIAYINIRYLGQAAEAVKAYRRSLELRPDDVQSQSNLAYAQFVAGDFDGAIDAYLAALRMAPDSIPLMSSLSNVYFRKRDTLRAFGLNDSIMKLNPELALPYVNMASFRLDLKDTVSAVAYFEQAYRRDQQNIRIRQFLFSYFSSKGEISRAALYK